MNSAQLRSVVEPVYNTVFDGIYDAAPTEWDKLFDVEKALPFRFHEDVSLYGLGLAQEKAEGGGVSYDQGGEAWRTRYTHRVYGLAFFLTEELVEDAEAISVGKVYAEHLAHSFLETKELVHANIFNLAFSNAQLGGDGVSLLNSAHPLAGGGTASNVLANPADLSEAGLEQMRAQIRTIKNERGYLAGGIKSKMLIVHPTQLGNATRIVKSEKRSGTADNDLNFIAASGMFPKGIMELTRLTNEKAWFIKTDAPRGLKHYWRRKLKRGMEEDFNTGNMRYKGSERYSAYWTDWRGLFGSQGV